MQCPGQDSRYWDGKDIFEIKCPKCGQDIEFFKDDSKRTCRNCGHLMLNPQIDFGCASYCPHAAQCLANMPDELKSTPEQSLKERIGIAMKRYFGNDFRRIGHAARVTAYAEEINRTEQGDPAVILAAALLHDIGIKEAERKFNSSSPRYQHQEGPPVAREILTELGADAELIDEVCDIVGHHHHPKPQETLNFKVLYDADLIVNIEDQQKESAIDQEKLTRIVNDSFLTPTGSQVAQNLFSR